MPLHRVDEEHSLEIASYRQERCGLTAYRALENAGPHVLAVYFDLDNGEAHERSGPDDVYELRVTLLYDSERDEEVAYAAAQKAADAIENSFAAALRTNNK